MIEALKRACAVCEHRSAVVALRQVIFQAGRVHAFNGVVQYQAPIEMEKEEEAFAVDSAKLAAALAAVGEEAQPRVTKDFLILKNGPLSVRIRKASPTFSPELIRMTSAARSASASPFLAALRRVAPFVSTDGSRPWSLSVLVRGGWAWATNNLSLVRVPLELPLELKVPLAAVEFLNEFEEVGYMEVDQQKRILVNSGKTLLRFPQSSADWPADMEKFFAAIPASMPPVPEELAAAVKKVHGLTDRFVSLKAEQVEARSDSSEATYSLDLDRTSGSYSAKLLLLILSAATTADFSRFPDPIFFAGEDGLQGTAVGIREEK